MTKTVKLIAGLALAITMTATAEEWTNLFDKDLSNFEVWMGIPHASV